MTDTAKNLIADHGTAAAALHYVYDVMDAMTLAEYKTSDRYEHWEAVAEELHNIINTPKPDYTSPLKHAEQWAEISHLQSMGRSKVKKATLTRRDNKIAKKRAVVDANESAVIETLIDLGAIFYCSHSGGKDSQAMYSFLLERVPAHQIRVVHSDLGEVEWEGVQEHIIETVEAHDVNVVRAGKTLIDMVERRFASKPEVPSWPSPAYRQCTSDLKRDPIYKFMRADMAESGDTLAVNCTGIRAEESTSRKKQPAFSLLDDLSKAGRTVFEWKPLFDWCTAEVFQEIRLAGQEPFWAYKRNTRLSCVFCIMGSANDLAHGADERPELYAKYLALEAKTGYTMFHKESLADKVAKGRTEAASTGCSGCTA